MRKPTLLLISVTSATLLLAAPSWQKKDFSQWTADDAKKILSDSPWAKTTHVMMSKTAMRMSTTPTNLASAEPPASVPPSNMAESARRYLISPAPEGYGSGQMNSGGGASGGQTGGQSQPQSGGAPGAGQPGAQGQAGQQSGAEPAAPQGIPIVVDWESAVPVRLAELKLKAGEAQPSQADVEQAKKPVDSYMIALVGVPGEPKQSEEQAIAAAATLTAKNKQPIQATSVKEQAMSGGTRAIIFTFPKTQPITDEDKSVQFQMKKNALPTEVKQSFKLKDMHYDGKLAL